MIIACLSDMQLDGVGLDSSLMHAGLDSDSDSDHSQSSYSTQSEPDHFHYTRLICESMDAIAAFMHYFDRKRRQTPPPYH